MHRAEVLKMQGSLARAEAEARLGCDGYKFDNSHLGWGWMQLGEIRLRSGDLEGSSDAFIAAATCAEGELRSAEGRHEEAVRLLRTGVRFGFRWLLRTRRRLLALTSPRSSTALATAMGEEEWDRVLRWHDRLLGDACGSRTGELRSVELKGLGAPTTVATVDWQH